MTPTGKIAVTPERTDLLETLAKHRYLLRFTVRDLTDEQAAQRTTASELCLGGLIKHVANTEQKWMDFVLRGPKAFGSGAADDWSVDAWGEEFRMLAGETLTGLLERYEQVARRTDEIVATVPDLDSSHPLPQAPWFEPGARWSARRTVLHVIAETAQHAGHADIIRESLDGSKSMG
ncbi:MAG: DinB family protein [Actinomycetota bacterium]|nr:DinB family protein [Actinomycetota bacterium]